MKKNPKIKRADAERATEWYAHEIMGCIRTVRSVKTQWQRQDMFSCDVLGKRADGSWVCLQVTAGQTDMVLERKKKLGREIWHTSDTVQVLQLRQTDNPGGGRVNKLWFFRVYEYSAILKSDQRYWTTQEDAIPVPREWFKKWKDKEIGL